VPDTPKYDRELISLARKLAMALEARDAAEALIAHYRQRITDRPGSDLDPAIEEALLHSVEKLRLIVVEDED